MVYVVCKCVCIRLQIRVRYAVPPCANRNRAADDAVPQTGWPISNFYVRTTTVVTPSTVV